jgi:citronellol/citronellal dehydrogenase
MIHIKEEEKLEGKVAIVTGASRGIGKKIAIELAKRGVKVCVAAKSEQGTEKLPGSIYDTVEEIKKIGGEAIAVKTDVRFEDDIKRMVEETVSKFGTVHILINNAGALWWQPVIETPPKRFDLVMQVNVRAAFLGSYYTLPYMMKQRWGHIINMSPPIEFSILPGKVAYLISKYGMTMLSMGLAEEVKEYNIAVNSLWPATAIESQATINFQLGDPTMWRKPDIVADAVIAIVSKPPSRRTGKALIDEDVLREEGITDFSHYACVPGTNPPRLIF